MTFQPILQYYWACQLQEVARTFSFLDTSFEVLAEWVIKPYNDFYDFIDEIKSCLVS